MSNQKYSDQVAAFSAAPSLSELPDIVEIRDAAPPNPPADIQTKFVGASYEQAYAEAESFITVADDFSAKHGRGGFASMERIIDFGSGWGRITRTLLAKTTPIKVFALDVDHQMTALINTTLPGVNALTVSPEPPTVLGDSVVDGLVAFSVFSHLSGPAHEAWAQEIGRLVRPSGVVAITVLDEAFFAQVAGAQAAVKAGDADAFAASLATTFPDVSAARRGYRAGEIQFAGTGGGEVRTGDYYGWAACSPKYIERVWGNAGLRVVEWVPSGVLFQQALVFLVADPEGSPVRSGRAGTRGTASSTVRSMIRRVRPER